MCSVLRNIDFILSLMGLPVGLKQVSKVGENMISQTRLPGPNPGSLTWHLDHLGKHFAILCLSFLICRV